jgi:hypothetical protein
MCVSKHPQGVTLSVKAFPKAPKNQILPPRNNALIVKLTSPPVEGKANKDLIKTIAKALAIAPSSIEIIKGETSREKTLLILDVTEDQAREALVKHEDLEDKA